MYYCKRCRNPVADGSPFCLNCGTPVEMETNQPAAPAPGMGAAPVAPAPTAPLTGKAAGASLQKYLHFIAVGIAALALIMSILNLFGLYDVTAVLKWGSMKRSVSYPVSDLYEEKPLILISNLLYGLVGLLIALIGTAYYLKVSMNNDLYDNFIGKFSKKLLNKFVDGDGVLTLMGILGAANVLVQWFLYLFTRESKYGVSGAFRIHYTSWIMLFVYLVVAGVDIFLLSKKKK